MGEQGAREEDQDRGPLPRHVQGPGSVLQQPRVLQRLPVCSGIQNEPGEEVRGLVMTETMMMMIMMMMMMVTAVMIREGEKQCQASVISVTLPGPSEYQLRRR